jgi:Domain of unknown function (DUF1918)
VGDFLVVKGTTTERHDQHAEIIEVPSNRTRQMTSPGPPNRTSPGPSNGTQQTTSTGTQQTTSTGPSNKTTKQTTSTGPSNKTTKQTTSTGPSSGTRQTVRGDADQPSTHLAADGSPVQHAAPSADRRPGHRGAADAQHRAAGLQGTDTA